MSSRKLRLSLDNLLLEQNDLQTSDIVSTILPPGQTSRYEQFQISRESKPTAERQSSDVLSALISPKLTKGGRQYRLSTDGNQCSDIKKPPMLLKFAESVEKQLVSSFGSLDLAEESTVTSPTTLRLQQNLKEFKQALHDIRSSSPKIACGHDSPSNELTTSLNNETPRAGGNEYVEEKMKPWIELTNVDFEPDMHPKRASRASMKQQKASRPKQHKLATTMSQLSDTSKDILVTPSTMSSIHLQDVGYVRFTFQFLIMTERLKVVVQHARNLFKNTDNSNEDNSFAEVCLLPGKVQLQTSEIMRKSKNPEFKSLFYFRGFTLSETHPMNLRVRLLGKKNILSRPKIIGEVVVSLENFDLVSETQLEEQLYTRIVAHSSGSIRFSKVSAADLLYVRKGELIGNRAVREGFTGIGRRLTEDLSHAMRRWCRVGDELAPVCKPV